MQGVVSPQFSTIISTFLNAKYSSALASAGNMLQHVPRLLETADNTERYV
jgi:hypothetical protein